MKLIQIFLLTALIVSCQKSNSLYHHRWKVQEGSDVATWNQAAFCFASDYGVIDTIELDFNALPDSLKFSLVVGSIYYPPNGRVETEVKGIYNRHYCKLLEPLD